MELVKLPEGVRMNLSEEEKVKIKALYNQTLKRHNDAVNFFTNPETPLEKKKSFLEAFQNIQYDLNFIIEVLRLAGEQFPTDAILNGFKK